MIDWAPSVRNDLGVMKGKVVFNFKRLFSVRSLEVEDTDRENPTLHSMIALSNNNFFPTHAIL